MPPELLSLDDIKNRIKERSVAETHEQSMAVAERYRYVRSLSESADGLIEVIQNVDGRFMLGLSEIDAMTRGFGRGELAYVTGKAHSGKTQLVLNGIVNNPGKRVIVFTHDEVSELVLSKLVSIKHGINAEEMEEKIKHGDQQMINLVRHAAEHDFRNLIVIDDSLSIAQMTDALNEAQDHWGEQCDAVVIDFLELIPGADEGHDSVVAKSQGVKRWTKNADVVTMCLHQASRSSGAPGQSAGMGAMRYGGETEAIFVLEVFRKRDDDGLDDFDRKRHMNTVSVNLCKNKRPPSKRGEVDLYMDPNTGLVRRMEADDMVVFGTPITSAAQANAVRHG